MDRFSSGLTVHTNKKQCHPVKHTSGFAGLYGKYGYTCLVLMGCMSLGWIADSRAGDAVAAKVEERAAGGKQSAAKGNSWYDRPGPDKAPAGRSPGNSASANSPGDNPPDNRSPDDKAQDEPEDKTQNKTQDKTQYNKHLQQLPSRGQAYGVGSGLLLAAANATDANPQGTSRITLGAGAAKTAGLPNIDINLKETVVKAKRYKSIGPLPGLNLTKEQIPGNIQSITAEEIKQSQSLSITDLMNSKLQSVNVNDYQGNPFQMDVTYRGFTAGPQIGTPQGLSIFFDGIRVNEPFGEVVNWDLIPMNAISSLDVYPGSNPMFGLNTLGGAIAIKTKSGFDSAGVSAQVLNGSFGRKQLQGSGGWNNGSLAAFGAVNLFMEDGWRKNSPSEVNQAFGKLEWQGEKASLGFSSLMAVNKLIGNGTVPIELYKEDPASVFTSPDITRNRLLQFQISGAFDFNDKVNLTGMVYKRDSRRVSSTGDIIDIDTFRDLGVPSRVAAPGELVSCVFLDSNKDGFANYYVDELNMVDAFGNPTSAFVEDLRANTQAIGNGYTPRYDLIGTINPDLPVGYIQAALQASNPGFSDGGFQKTDSLGQQQVFNSANFYNPEQFFYLSAYATSPTSTQNYFTTVDPVTNQVRRFNIIPAPRVNADDSCPTSRADGTKLPAVGNQGHRDGAVGGNGLGTNPGYIQGTPTGVITKSDIDQSGLGGAVQLNFNLDTHKLMFGASIDSAGAKYDASQRFGLIDDSRNVYSAPNDIGEEYFAADHDVPVNKFDGKKITKSLYMSETWSPTQTLNFSASARYNQTLINNSLAARAKFFGLADANLLNRFLPVIICPGDDLSACPYDPSHPLDIDIYRQFNQSGSSAIPGFNPISPAVTEKFSYYSLNPALGATWQATPRLNMYANWNQGTRTPSVIELGCAFDATPTQRTDIYGNPVGGIGPRTLVDGRACSLPSVLSGDPYLPQVKAQTFEVGARGKFKDLLEWNVTAYRTELKDDIYLVSATSELSYFQNIGDTRRQGIEFGLAGEYGRHDFRVNYSLTEATFQSSFKMISANNSSIISNDTSNFDYNQIQVEPGDRMPGVPLNNFNISWGFKVTPTFKLRLGMVAHGDAFLRGNENNEHTPGPSRGRIDSVLDPITGGTDTTLIPGSDYRYSGKSAGYATFNLRATYDMGAGWTAGLLINNLLDKEYTSAGRLGLTPFAPSINGVVGAGGFNYNSSEWLSTQFISAGAPRGVWATISYDFDASKKRLPPPTSMAPEPDRTLEPATIKPPTAEELALAKTLDGIKPVPVIAATPAQARLAIEKARQQVAAAVEAWRVARARGDVDGYLSRYSRNFQPAGLNRNAWLEQSRLQLATAQDASLKLEEMVVLPQGKGMTAVFNELGAAGGMQPKALSLEQQDGQWVIERETVLRTSRRDPASADPVLPAPAKQEKSKAKDKDQLSRLETGKSLAVSQVASQVASQAGRAQ